MTFHIQIEVLNKMTFKLLYNSGKYHTQFVMCKHKNTVKLMAGVQFILSSQDLALDMLIHLSSLSSSLSPSSVQLSWALGLCIRPGGRQLWAPRLETSFEVSHGFLIYQMAKSHVPLRSWRDV